MRKKKKSEREWNERKGKRKTLHLHIDTKNNSEKFLCGGGYRVKGKPEDGSKKKRKKERKLNAHSHFTHLDHEKRSRVGRKEKYSSSPPGITVVLFILLFPPFCSAVWRKWLLIISLDCSITSQNHLNWLLKFFAFFSFLQSFRSLFDFWLRRQKQHEVNVERRPKLCQILSLR